MKNETSYKYFYILPFSEETRNNPSISAFFFLIYVAGVVINSSIITVICLDVQLHKPMYLFISNLSIIDIFSTSVTVPKLLHVLISGDYIVSISQCYTQLFFFSAISTAQDLLLYTMAYDRYVAICIPLHYQQILSRRNCTLIIIGLWTAAIFNSVIFVTSAFYMSSCHSNIIHQFFCDAKSLTKISCTTTEMFLVIMSVEMFIFGCLPIMCTLISYVKIFSIIFKIKSKESRKKSFSTCSSHVTVISIYYGAGLIAYVIPRYSEVLDSVFDIVYTTIVPMINPIIYSLQNSNVQSALLKLMGGMCNLRHVHSISP